MTDLLQLNESDIRSLASGQSFDRGYRYYRNGYVHGVTRRGNLITANVEGSEYEPYQVQVRLAGHRVDTADCTCPYDWGGYCKHIVATLLYYLHNRDEIEEKPELETMLAGLTEAQLRQLILNVAEGEPGLIDAVEREIEWLQETPARTVVTDDSGASIRVDVNAIRREIYREFRQVGSHDEEYYDYYGDYGPEVNADLFLEPHLEKVQALLDAGDVATATSVLTGVVEAWIDGLSDLDEWIYEYNQDVIGDAQLNLAAHGLQLEQNTERGQTPMTQPFLGSASPATSTSSTAACQSGANTWTACSKRTIASTSWCRCRAKSGEIILHVS